MLEEKYMWSVSSGLYIELTCAVVMSLSLYVDRLHRGDSFFNFESVPTKFLWAKVGLSALYLADVLLALAFMGNSVYQNWRLGGYLRAALFVVVHRNTLAIWWLHLQMMPHFAEILSLIAMFVCFYAIIAMNVFQEGKEGNEHFETLSQSLWSLTVLLTTANFPDVFLTSFSNSRWSMLYFVSFLVFGTFGLVYLLMATVFAQVSVKG